MAETQLEQGPIEELGPDAQPRAKPLDDVVFAPDGANAPDGSNAPLSQAAPVPSGPVFSSEELAAEVDPFSAGVPAPFSQTPDSDAPLNMSQLEGIARTLSAASYKDITIDDVRRSFNEGVFGTKVDEAVSEMLKKQGSEKETAMLQLLNRGDLSVDQRLSLIRELDRNLQGPDQNAYERTALRDLNIEENSGYSDEDEARFNESLQIVNSMPVLARAETPLSKEELQASFTELLNLYALDAEERSRMFSSGGSLGLGKIFPKHIASFLPNLIPFFSTVPVVKVLSEMNTATGGDVGMSTVSGVFLPGTAIRSMRERIEEMPLEEKIKAFTKIVSILKGNKGIFPTQNAHIQSYLIQSIFYKDLTGTDYIKEATDSENKAYIKARLEAERFQRLALHEEDRAKAVEYARARNLWNEKAREIDQNASGRLWHEYNGTSFGQWIDDLAILDFAVLTPLARSTIKAGQKAVLAPFRRGLKIAPDKTTKQFVSMLQDPRVRKQYSDMLGEDVAETMLPAAVKGAQEAGVEGMGELTQRSVRLAQEMKQTLREGSNVTAASQRAYVAELRKIFGDATQKPMMHATKSRFSATEDGVDFTVHYGATPTRAFGTYEAAKRALDQMPFNGKIVRFADDKFKPATPSNKIDQYFIEFSDRRTYDSSRSAWEQALFDRAQVRAPWFLPVNSAIGGKAAKQWNWFYSSSDMFGPDIFNRITSDVMRAATMQKLHTGFVRTMLHLPTKKEQALVSSLLKQGEEIPTVNGKGTVFTVEQIKTMHPYVTDKVIAAYYEARNLADNMYDLSNQQLRSEYFRNGVKDIVSPSGHVGFGRVLPTADDAVGDIKTAQNFKTLHAFDSETGEFKALTRADIDKVYADGGRLARMEELVQNEKFAEATHVIMGKGARAMELPSRVLPYINGYYPHIFSSNYIVYGVSKAGNKVAMATARSAADAAAEKARLEKMMRRMKDKAPYTSIDYRFDRSLRDPLTHQKDVSDPLHGASEKIYGSRSGHMLQNASKKYGDHMADPVEALLRGSELVSHSVTKGNLIQNMEARLFNTLRLMEREHNATIIKNRNRVVRTPEDINYIAGAEKDLQKATAYMHQIDLIRRIPDSAETHMASIMAGAGEILYRLAKQARRVPLPGSKSLAADIDRLQEVAASAASRGVDPMRLLTEIAHRVYIAGNPLQQFALQAGQAALLLGIAPRELPRAISSAVPMHMLVSTRVLMNSGEKGFVEAYKSLLPRAAKAIGMAPDKLDKMVGVIERSGLVDTVSMHSQITTAARSSAMTRRLAQASSLNQATFLRNTTEALRRVDETTFGKLSQYGFETGEQLNRIMTFMALYRRDVRKGIANLDSPQYIQKAMGEVNTLVGSMLRETSLAYQRGWLKAAFQFVAFQHKMATMMLFSKNLSWQQKVGLTLSQFFLYGSRGAAHLDAFHRAMEQTVLNYEAANPEEKSAIVEAYWHPATQTALDGLVFDLGVNAVLRAAGGEDTPGFAWNRRLAPGGGSQMLVDVLVDLRHNPTEQIFGLGGKLFDPADIYKAATQDRPQYESKVVLFFDKLRRTMLAQAKDMDAIPAEERFKLLAKEGAALAFSGYDKYLQAAVMKGMGGPVTTTGNIGMSANTKMERVLAASLGVTTEDRQAFMDAVDKYHFDVRNDPERHKEAMDAITDQLWKEMVMDHIKLKGQAATPEVFEDMQRELIREKTMQLSFLTPHESEVVSENIGNKIAAAIKNRNAGTTAEQAFVDDLTKDIREGNFGDKESLEWEVYLRRTPLYQNHPQMMGEFREARRQLLTYDDEVE